MNWNLKEIFNNIDEYNNCKNIIEKDIKELLKTKKISSKNLYNTLELVFQMKELNNKILLYGSLKYYKDINNNECINLKKDAEEFYNEINNKLKYIDKLIIDSNAINFINEDERILKYAVYLDNIFRKQNHLTNNEFIKINKNIINDNLKKYNDLVNNMKFDSINNINLTPSNIGKYDKSNDREIRKNVYNNKYNEYQKKENDFVNILNNIFYLRTKNCKINNYKSVLEESLFEENINPLIIDKLIVSVNKNIYLMDEYYKMKFEFLNINNPKYYDIQASLINDLEYNYTLDEAIEIIFEAIKPLGKRYTSVVKKLISGHIDAELNDLKHQSIVFSWNTFSFMNFRGTYTDLKNLIHEIGHIVNYYLSSKKQPFIYEDSTIFVGEVASITNEILLNNYLYNHALNDKEKIFYLSKEIEKYISLIYKQTMYTEFENKLYNIKENDGLTNEIIKTNYFKLLKKYYGNSIELDSKSKIEWTTNGHIYRHAFYNYKYATGMIISSIVTNNLLIDKNLKLNEYIKFLELGSSMYSLDLIKKLNIDLLDTSVIDNGFDILKNDIEKLKKLI